jgi:hypothetical protein
MTNGAGVCSRSANKSSAFSRSQIQTTHPAMRTILALVQCPQAQRTNVACNVVAGGNRVVGDGAGADEAHLDVAVGAFVLCVILDLEVW